METRIANYDGTMRSDGEWLYLKACSDLTLLTDISLSYELAVSTETAVGKIPEMDYKELLERHADIHGEMFNRFSLSFGGNEEMYQTPDQLIQSSSFGNLNNNLVVELCEAARYIIISATGEIPHSVVGIWGGTWRPEWSGDFTSWRMRQKNKFKQQEHRTFINWFISVPAKITRSGHQMELKLYEHHFHKADWEELDKLIEAAEKTKKEGKYENQPKSIWARYVLLAQNI